MVAASLSAQHVDQGYYNDFDFGPHGVYGNLKLEKVTGREYYEIKKTSDSTVRSIQMNPSGIPKSTYIITFKNGLISHIEKIYPLRYGIFLNILKAFQFLKGEEYTCFIFYSKDNPLFSKK